jgi:hypothetical protein
MSNTCGVQPFQDGSVKPQQDDHHASVPSSERPNARRASAPYKTDQPEQELAAGLASPTERKEGQADPTGTGPGFGEQHGASKEALRGPSCSAPKERYEYEMKMDEAKGQLTGSKSCQYFALSSARPNSVPFLQEKLDTNAY